LSRCSRLCSDLLGFAGVVGRPPLAPEQARLLLLPEAIALALDVDGGRVMEQPVEDRLGEDRRTSRRTA
jgi:hypothetical protein